VLQPAQHDSLERYLLTDISHHHAKKCCMRLGCNAMDLHAERRVHPIAFDEARRELGLGVLGQWQHVAEGAEASHRVK